MGSGFDLMSLVDSASPSLSGRGLGPFDSTDRIHAVVESITRVTRLRQGMC